jgi:hypothetical protein
MDSGPQYPPPGTKLNQGTFPILLVNSSWIAVLNIRLQVWNYNPGTFPTYIRKFFMDSCPQYPPPGMQLNQRTFPIL